MSLSKWVSDRQAEARRYLADHAEPDDASLIATCSADVIRYVGVVRGVRLCRTPAPRHSAGSPGRGGRPFRRRGVAALLMDAAGQLARDPGITTLAITVGLFDEQGPAQRLYG